LHGGAAIITRTLTDDVERLFWRRTCRAQNLVVVERLYIAIVVDRGELSVVMPSLSP
jgi:hypothetical protein